jgi:hypothetical protein
LSRSVRLDCPLPGDGTWWLRLRAKNALGWSGFSDIMVMSRASHPSLFMQPPHNRVGTVVYPPSRSPRSSDFSHELRKDARETEEGKEPSGAVQTDRQPQPEQPQPPQPLQPQHERINGGVVSKFEHDLHTSVAIHHQEEFEPPANFHWNHKSVQHVPSVNSRGRNRNSQEGCYAARPASRATHPFGGGLDSSGTTLPPIHNL